MIELILRASRIRESHRQARINALQAEAELLGLGFTHVEFNSHGVSSVTYLGIRYPLGDL